MRTQRWLIGLAIGVLVLVGGVAATPLSGVARQDSTPPAEVSEDEAASIALEANPGAEVVEIEAEEEDGRLVYEVTLSTGVEVEIDATTGEILETEQGDDDEEAEGEDDAEEEEDDEGDEEDDDADSEEDEDEPGDVDDEDDAENGEEDDEDEEEDEDEDEDDGEDDDAERSFSDTFYLDECEWSSTGGNPFFRLEPGLQLVLQGEEDGETVEAIVTVLDETEMVGEIETRVVEERESAGGELVEVSRNYFAVCSQTNSVFYFGETVEDYEEGEVVGSEGAWRAGEGEALPGLIMPAEPLLGARYYQEIAPGAALDRTEVVEVGVQIDTPAGTFDGCFRSIDSSPLEPDARDEKVYCPGVGNVQDESLLLVSVGPAAEATPGA